MAILEGHDVSPPFLLQSSHLIVTRSGEGFLSSLTDSACTENKLCMLLIQAQEPGPL